MKTQWLNKKADLKKEAISQWVASLTENDARLLEILCDEIRERAMMELAGEVDKLPCMRAVQSDLNSFRLIKAPSFRLI